MDRSSVLGMDVFLLFLISTLLSITLFHEPINLVTANEELIHKTCKSTIYYQLCLASLKSNPGSQEADTKGLAMIMVGIGLVNATETSSFLSSQVTNTMNNTRLMEVLKECSDKYSYAGDALEASVQDLADDAYDYAYTRIAAAADYPNACKSGFKRYSGLAYPRELARREDGLKRICAVVLGIIDLLDLVGPVAWILVSVEQTVHDLIDEGIDEGVAVDSEDSTYSASGAGEPREGCCEYNCS